MPNLIDRDQRIEAAIEAFARSQLPQLRRLASSVPPDLQAAYAALASGIEVAHGTKTWAEAGQELDQGLAAIHGPADLVVCLLYLAFQRAEGDDRLRLLERMRACQSGLSHPRSRVVLIRAEVILASQDADYRHARVVVDAGLAILPKGHDAWLECLAHAVNCALNDEDPAAAERYLVQLQARRQAAQRCGIDVVALQSGLNLLIDCGEAVLAARAGDDRLDDVATLGALLATGRLETLEHRVAAIRAQAADLQENAREQARLTLLAEFTAANLALARQDYHLAGELNRRTGASVAVHPRLLGQLLVLELNRALCQRQADHARALLQRLDPHGRRGDLRLEWARLHLLEGDLAGAGRHFARLLAAGCPGLVTSRLRYAHELDTVAVAKMWFAASVPSTPTSPPELNYATDRHEFVGASSQAVAIRRHIAELAPLSRPVLIEGDTGTGKEVVARLLHAQGSSPQASFVAVNCAALPDSLAEAELFGHRKGAFTGAANDHPGLLGAADGGTLFLDELNSLSLRLQGLLLRVLEDGEYRQLGATKPRPMRVRFIAASNGDLVAACESGSFRRDLYFRLQGFAIRLPTLAERREDLPMLIRFFLQRFSGRSDLELDPPLSQAFQAHAWPGNVRELRDRLERLVLLRGDRRRFTVADCPDLLGSTPIRGALSAAPTASRQPVPGPPRARARRHRLLELFATTAHVYREDVVALLGGSPTTATKDLAALEAAGLIRRVLTSGHLRTSYFVRCT